MSLISARSSHFKRQESRHVPVTNFMRIQDTVNVLNIRGLLVVLSARHRSLGTWVGAAGFYTWMKACKRLFPPIHCSKKRSPSSDVDKPVARSSRAMGTSNALCILQTPASTGWFLPVIGFHPAIRMWSGWLSHKIPPVTSQKKINNGTARFG